MKNEKIENHKLPDLSQICVFLGMFKINKIDMKNEKKHHFRYDFKNSEFSKNDE